MSLIFVVTAHIYVFATGQPVNSLKPAERFSWEFVINVS